MEIVTWVLDGQLEHKDTTDHHGLIYPGLAQKMTAGAGILHSEMNPSAYEDVHFVQMWVVPDTESAPPAYAQLDLNDELGKGGLVPVASGRGHDAAIPIRQRDATLWAGRLQPGETVTVPDAPFVHVFVARGAVELEGAGSLVEGDAVRVTGAGALRLTAGPDGAEPLIWEMHASLG
jgi:redox-sensitive bicupin YhaK (pirin superfamily)